MKKGNARIIHVGNTILDAAVEDRINKNWRLLDNQSTCNTFINGKYLSNIRNAPDGKYLRFHCNAGVKQSKKIGDLHGYSNPVWYKPKGIANILYLGLAQKNHLVAYNTQYGNEFVVHSPHRPTLNITKAVMLYHDMRQLFKKKYGHTMVNDSHSPIPQVKDKKKWYNARDIKRADLARWLQNITGQPINRILHEVDNNIIHNLPILR